MLLDCKFNCNTDVLDLSFWEQVYKTCFYYQILTLFSGAIYILSSGWMLKDLTNSSLLFAWMLALNSAGACGSCSSKRLARSGLNLAFQTFA